ncbi:protein spinster isoform X1 [Episyrphus balteatus]|uniref:protein spinster isoform X1 n=2 Tax=Episyrphus balteatus TaxID=286459 RepID=UPI002485DC2B|nr:protein spinster isoform X1 [Episyrphus balteatus]
MSSSSGSHQRLHQGYNPLSTMDNASVATAASDDSVAGIASAYSSQKLMPTDSNSNSSEENMLQPVRIANTRSSVSCMEWFTVGVLCFVNLINYMDRFTIAGVLTDIQSDFKIGDDDGGLLQTAFVLSYMICAPIFGYLGDRYSRKWIMAIGVLLWSTTTILGSFMNNFGWFITFRALVGIGEASYSTIAPTLISDLFVNEWRSKMLVLFYFAIPVGSGLGYIVGAETAAFAGSWRWALRVTPFLGIIAVVLIFLIIDPERGESEGSNHLETTTYTEDVKDLVKNRSFMLSTMGFTCVTFVAGALAWWGPKYIYLGLRMQPGNEGLTQKDVSYQFGLIAMTAGIAGVPLGSFLSQYFRRTIPNCDPYICACGLLLSSPMVYLALILPRTSSFMCYSFVWLAQITLNITWSIVADILLYVVVPTRRSTAEAFQILISHAFGDAGSPYLVGVLSEAIKKHLRNSAHTTSAFVSNGLESLSLSLENATTTEMATLAINPLPSIIVDEDTNLTKFEALQYALFSTSFVEVIGGIFFLLTAAFIIKDKTKASQAVIDSQIAAQSQMPMNIEQMS